MIIYHCYEKKYSGIVIYHQLKYLNNKEKINKSQNMAREDKQKKNARKSFPSVSQSIRQSVCLICPFNLSFRDVNNEVT